MRRLKDDLKTYCSMALGAGLAWLAAFGFALVVNAAILNSYAPRVQIDPGGSQSNTDRSTGRPRGRPAPRQKAEGMIRNVDWLGDSGLTY